MKRAIFAFILNYVGWCGVEYINPNIIVSYAILILLLAVITGIMLFWILGFIFKLFELIKEIIMAVKNKNAAGMKKCVCSACLIEEHSIPGTTHRRCPGQADQPLRKKGDYIAVVSRGTWA